MNEDIVNLEFTMLGPRLTAEEEAVFARVAQWVVVTERKDRLLVDGIGRLEDIKHVLDALVPRDPQIVGAWAPNGSMLPGYALGRAAWLYVAPDNEDGSRPTGYRQLHGWAGWADRRVE